MVTQQCGGARLRVLHTRAYPGSYDDLVVSRTEDAEWVARSRAVIEVAHDEIGDDLAGVDVDIEVRNALCE